MKPGVLGLVAIVLLFVVLHLTGPMPEGGSRALAATTLGGTAFILMAASIFLSTRPRWLETAFGGLDRMYQVHKISGVSAGLLVLIHFFAAPKDLPPGVDAVASALVPSAPLGMLALILLVISLALTLNRKIAYHRWRIVHKAMGVVFIIAFIHFFTAPEVFMPKQGASGLILFVAALIGVGAWLANLVGLTRRGGHRFEIEAVNHLERATEVVLKPLDKMFEFTPGQFAFVEFDDAPFREPHPFTISSAPGEDRLRFTMKTLGDWTRRVREDLTSGGQATIRGPYGRFDAAAAGPKQVWLAGGIGITPFLSKVRAMASSDPRQIWLVYAVREASEAVFLDELRKREAELPNLTVVLLESNNGDFARVDKMQENLPGDLGDYDYFLCGPRPMVDGLKKDLRKAGVTAAKLHSEAFEFR